MKHQFSLVLFLAICLSASAQNYQCIQAATQHYFINSNGYLRSIVIDSVSTSSDTTTYFPFHTPRGSYDISRATPLSLDPNGGSWLGKKVLQLSDGTFIFDSYWNDSVIIKTQANIGESWVFYSDPSSLYYKATLVSKDTMTILSSLDSEETIMINAYDGSALVTADPLDSFTIILSKNNGFVQVFDLYTFPYHKPDSTYRPGLDYFLDRATCTYDNIDNAPGISPAPNITLFKLVDFINPNDQQLHNWNVGDVFESYHSFANYPFPYSYVVTDPVSYYDYILETVTSKTISGHAINYTLSGDHYTCSYFTDPCQLIDNAGNYSFYDNIFSIADSAFIPEESVLENYIFYFPHDSSNCLVSPEYIIVVDEFEGDGAVPPVYKLGIGMTYNADFDDDDFIWESDGLTYTNINGVSCGTLVGVKNISMPLNKLEIYPNPATTSLTITSESTINQITITNLLGETIFGRNFNADQAQVDVSKFPAGIYFVKVNGIDVQKFVKE